MVEQPKARPRSFASFSICCASSRVGAMTTAAGATGTIWYLRPGRGAGAPELARVVASHMSGTRKPIVLPDPVCATAITSRPASVSGSDCAWIGVG